MYFSLPLQVSVLIPISDSTVCGLPSMNTWRVTWSCRVNHVCSTQSKAKVSGESAVEALLSLVLVFSSIVISTSSYEVLASSFKSTFFIHIFQASIIIGVSLVSPIHFSTEEYTINHTKNITNAPIIQYNIFVPSCFFAIVCIFK